MPPVSSLRRLETPRAKPCSAFRDKAGARWRARALRLPRALAQSAIENASCAQIGPVSTSRSTRCTVTPADLRSVARTPAVRIHSRKRRKQRRMHVHDPRVAVARSETHSISAESESAYSRPEPESAEDAPPAPRESLFSCSRLRSSAPEPWIAPGRRSPGCPRARAFASTCASGLIRNDGAISASSLARATASAIASKLLPRPEAKIAIGPASSPSISVCPRAMSCP